ncbi:N-acetylglucosaminyl-diphospho-decaprenol L-rhamnosyltransferase [Kordia antarctica]|uniref:N-acetylglucosaminyl-diphospho-decaprenol L-rhamnosyltransferase n=1 Tax=Kordia antarctica TaxID=1218801 RepID=A0A7L4ZDN7_9FLAO|nr:glycosyltransferase family 2 protein [Kordia antarctica]QHI34908.1 N-acetylglucosaminyl-diphospho-decaprenol L-rhamnosyltransferase [Kordia antarctica]
MKIAIIILNWNGKQLLEQFLPSVIAFSREATIYVADNASSDDSVQYVKNHFPNVRIIQNAENGGYAKGYNDSLPQVEEAIFCLLNSDIEVTENWLAPILPEFESNPQTAIIQPKILDFKQKTHFEYAGAAGGFVDKYGYPFCRGRIFHTLEKDTNQYNDNATIFWASGACFFIRKDVFHELNGFDEDFFAHQEEIDLCWRAFNLGYKTKYISECVVFHVGGATLNSTNPKKTYLNFRNSLCMLAKNLPKGKLIPIIVSRLFLDGIAAIQFLAKLQFKHFVAVLKAHFHFYARLPKMLKKRGESQQSAYFQEKSIVYSYFLKGKKTYSEL